MIQNKTVLAAFLMAAGALALQATGCELVTSFDRGLIDAGADAGDAGCSGAQAACTSPTDCPAQATTCIANACNGCCSTSNAAAGTACSDNGGKVCDGSGKCAACLAPTDCPAPATACKVNACDATAHTCGTTNVAKGTTCSDSGGVVCDGNGACVAAHCADGVKDSDETDVDCGGSCGATCKDTAPQQACKVAGDCVSGVCSGTPLLCQPPTCTDTVKNGNETGPDCGGAQCVGLGKTCGLGVACGVNSDCTSNPQCNGPSFTGGSSCNNGVCAAAAATDCSATGKVCDPVAGCVACNAPSDCPATGNECIANTCSNHACGTSFLGGSHVLSTGQTAGDCQSIVCNGAGGTTSVDDGTDPPPASATVCASAPQCTGSPLAPTYTFAATGTNCSADGQYPKTVCGDTADVTVAGKCVECNVNVDCNAVNDAGALSCISHVCQ